GRTGMAETSTQRELLTDRYTQLTYTSIVNYSYNSTTGPQTVSPSNAGTWLFASSGTNVPFNLQHMSFTGPPSNNIQADPNFTISPSDTSRLEPWGIDGSNAFSNTEVISMNEHVRGMMSSV